MLRYLVDPIFQVINTAGKPATGGYIEVYLHGTRDKYYCASDFEGTLHPFKIPLDSLGSNIILADDVNAYDIYVYNRYGSLLMSRYGVTPVGGPNIDVKTEIVYIPKYTDFAEIAGYIRDGKTVILKDSNSGNSVNWRLYYPYTVILPDYEDTDSRGILDFVELDIIGTHDVENPNYPDPADPNHYISPDPNLYAGGYTVQTQYDSESGEWQTTWNSREVCRCVSMVAFNTWMQWIKSQLSNVNGGVDFIEYDEGDTEAYDRILNDLNNGILPIIQDETVLIYFDYMDESGRFIFHAFVYEIGAYIVEVVVTEEGMEFVEKTLLMYKLIADYDQYDDGSGNVHVVIESNQVRIVNFDNQQFNYGILIESNWDSASSGKAQVIIKDIVPKAVGVSVLVKDSAGTVYKLASDSLQTIFDAGSYVVDIDGDVVRITMLNSSRYKMKSIGTQDFIFNNGIASVNTQTNYRYVLDDWDGEWAMNTVLVNPPGGYNINVVVRFMNVQCSLAQGMQIAVSGGMTKVGDSLDRIYHGRSYELTIVGNSWYLAEIYNTDVLYVTDDDLKNALAVIKSRIIYTIPIGSVGRIEQIKLDANGTDIALHATLFNPNMDQDLNTDSNVVVNFGSSGNNFSGSEFMLFAVYEFDRINRIWKWVANTDAIANTGSNVTGIQHYTLAYRDANKTKLESAHLYLLVCAGRKNTVEIMGNQLEANLNMSSQSLAIATGKQNNSGYTGAANFGTDFATLDLTTFSEAQANSRVGNQQAARVFAVFTNLKNLP